MELKNLTTSFLGRNLLYYETIDSTQLEAWRLVEKEKVPNGTVLMAELQTSGKRYTW